MSFDSTTSPAGPSSAGIGGIRGSAVSVFPRRAMTMAADDLHLHSVVVYLFAFNSEEMSQRVRLDFHKRSTTEELVERIIDLRSDLPTHKKEDFELFETMGTLDGRMFKERRLDAGEYPVAVQTLWPKAQLDDNDDPSVPRNRFVLHLKGSRPTTGGQLLSGSATAASTIDSFLAKFLTQPQDREYADLCMLPELTEQTLLDNLRERFNSGHIYTYIGPILVAVNPFQFFPIYNPKYSTLYCQSRRLGALPPHIFAIADVTYHNMLRNKESQCVVISGESGSGKTESTNFLLHHLTTLSQKGTTGSTIEQMLLSAGPVLEAFGNAVTVQNNNSSRFGKFIKVNYRENGMVLGASVEIYLLEKSRIISQAIGERNYHVFYYLLEGSSEAERKEHFLLEPKDYYYLNQNSFFACEAMNEKHEYERLRHAMTAVGFSHNAQQKTFRIISAVLALGNIEYIRRPGYHSDENAFIENEELVGVVAGLLSIRAQQLTQALTMRRTVLKKDTVIARYSVAEAIQTRDAMAKCLYNALFNWIVLKINASLIRKEATAAAKNGFYIGILDIFGFEDVGAQWNSFEQLCINYANERLQAYFNQHIFQFEQEEYLKEDIAWTPIAYTDNTECVQLFQSKPYGLLRLVDEESNINNGTDQSMLDKLNQFLKGNEYYEIPHKREPAFIIAHYAGKVKYQIQGFREKNKDLMRQDVLSVLKSSRSAFTQELVGDDPVAIFRWGLVRATFRAMFAFRQGGRRTKRAGSVDRLAPSEAVSSAGQLLRRSSDSHLSAFLRGDLTASIVPDFCDTSVFKTIFDRARKTPTRPHNERQSHLRSLQAVKEMVGKRPISSKPISVSRQFGESLSRLMKTLAQANPYFIRCIKSNNEKVPNFFDDNIILRQLRYTGMLETVRIRRAGYSVRIEYESFVSQYRILLPNAESSTRKDIEQFITNHAVIDTANIQYGKTKVFMRDAEKLLLDDHLHRAIMEKIVTIQRWFRAMLVRKRFVKLRNGIIKLQALTRGTLIRNNYRRRLFAALYIQCWWRMEVAQRRYFQIRETIVRIQAVARGRAQRKRLEEMRASKENVLIRRKRFGPVDLSNITKVQTISLPKFDLDDPTTLAGYSTDDSDFEDTSSLSSVEHMVEPLEEQDEDQDEDVFSAGDDQRVLSDGKMDSSEIDLDASFILEDTRLKLIHSNSLLDAEKGVLRRQSLATTASTTTKMRTLRRAASTDSGRGGDAGTTAGSAADHGKQPVTLRASKVCKSGLMKAKKQLKALLSRKQDGSGQGTSTFSDEDLRQQSSGEGTNTTRSSSKEAERRLTTVMVAAPKCHSFKMSRLHKGDSCSLCNRPLGGLLVQGFKCFGCKLAFHKECSSFASKIPCTTPITSPIRPEHYSFKRPWESLRSPRPSIPLASEQPFASIGSFNLTKTQQQSDPTALLIESTDDLRQFSVFIFKKQTQLSVQSQNKRDSVVDAVFKRSLREFHMELIGMEVMLMEENTVLKYRDLIRTFEGLLTKMCHEEKVSFPTTLGVNAFRGFLNEFMQQRVKRRGSNRRSTLIKNVRKKRRKSDVTLHNGHRFYLEFVHVPTYCEICNQFMWHAEKIFICVNCRLSCHKKCHTKVSYICPKAIKSSEAPTSSQFFGADLSSLLVDDKQSVPILLNKLLVTIEVKALFVEGIYRKSGALAAIKATRRAIESADDPESLAFDDMPIHVLTSLIKAFFRELTEPLITYELYENFVNISEIKETGERIRCLRAMTEMLPRGNKCVLDRLVYHLARVAHQESVNRMSASNLAVIFAPCIVRRNQSVHAQEQLMDVQKQAICVQTLIEDKLRQCQETLTQIVELENASEKVTENLRRIEEHRQSSGGASTSDESKANINASTRIQQQQPSTSSADNIETARQLFEEQLDFLDKEKAKLMSELPPLAPVASSEDLSSSDVENSDKSVGGSRKKSQKASLEALSLISQEEYALDLSTPPILARLPNQFKDKVKKRPRVRPPSTQFMTRWRESI